MFEGFACGGSAVRGDCAEVCFGEEGADIEAVGGFGEEELLLCGLDERGHLLLEEFFLLLEAVEILGSGVLEVLEFLLEGSALRCLRGEGGKSLSDGFDLLSGAFLLLLVEEEREVEGFDAGELLLGAGEGEAKERAVAFDGFDLFELFGGALPSGFVEGVLLDVDFLKKVFGGSAGFEKSEANPERLAPRGLEEIKASAEGREEEKEDSETSEPSEFFRLEGEIFFADGVVLVDGKVAAWGIGISGERRAVLEGGFCGKIEGV